MGQGRTQCGAGRVLSCVSVPLQWGWRWHEGGHEDVELPRLDLALLS